jgi:colicin import membrane protein
MSAITYSEPYKLPAGMLALAVHAAFLALLYFGISWQTQPPQGMVVDIWESLPVPETAPAKVEPPPLDPPPVEKIEPPKPVVPPRLAEPVRPVAPPKADIELDKKKKQQVKPVEVKKPVEMKQPVKATKPVEKPQPVVPKLSEAEQAEQSAQAEQARARAAQDAAIGKVVDEYKARIVAKIRRNIVMPPDVPNNAKAEFDVTLLPGGSLLNARLVKTSGNAAYDGAVERAIIKAQPLPLPPDVALFNKFRELHLIFSPVE